jgi:hypothetical protein
VSNRRTLAVGNSEGGNVKIALKEDEYDCSILYAYMKNRIIQTHYKIVLRRDEMGKKE